MPHKSSASEDPGPQVPTNVTGMLKFGTNLLQAVGQFNVLQDYLQPAVTSVDSGKTLALKYSHDSDSLSSGIAQSDKVLIPQDQDNSASLTDQLETPDITSLDTQIRMDTPSGIKDSIPAWIKFAVQALGEIPYRGIYYDPLEEVRF
ncbi:hypothetical protein JHK85_017404 [Glycine max]|nr:hypothetical protein JHK85_017404 [Glycine max]